MWWVGGVRMLKMGIAYYYGVKKLWDDCTMVKMIMG